MKLWRRWLVILFALFGVVGLVSSADDCPDSDVSVQECNMDTAFKRWDGEWDIAGFCSDEPGGRRCKCTPPFQGPACDRTSSASSPDNFWTGYPTNGSELSGVSMRSWAFLAKSCWAKGSYGRLRVQLRYKRVNCTTNSICTVYDEEVYNQSNTPNIIFYAHYDQAFQNAVLFSYIPPDDKETNEVPENPYCSGQAAVYSEQLLCQPNRSIGSHCTVDKTYQVKNNGDEETMIYIALGGCFMSGLVMWNITVETYGSPGRAEVCGAGGTSNTFRCYSEAGGQCSLQSFTKFTTQFEQPHKLSKTAIAIISAAFVGVFTLGIVCIKIFQSRYKRAKQQGALERMTGNGTLGGANGVGTHVANGRRTSVPPRRPSAIGTFWSPNALARTHMSPEEMTGHVAISGGLGAQ